MIRLSRVRQMGGRIRFGEQQDVRNTAGGTGGPMRLNLGRPTIGVLFQKSLELFTGEGDQRHFLGFPRD